MSGSSAVEVVVGTPNGSLRTVVRGVLEHEGMAVVGEARSWNGLADVCAAAAPTVVVADLPLDGDAVALAEVLSTGARLLLLVLDPDQATLTDALLAGASGYVVMDEVGPEELVRAVTTVAKGDAALHPAIAQAILTQWRNLRTTAFQRPQRGVELTAREQDVVTAMSEGLGVKEIAKRLNTATKTVENHKSKIFAKLGARNQAQAVALAIEQGLIPVSQPGTG